MLTQEDIKWIVAHKRDDIAKLLLRYGNEPEMVHRIMQIESRRKYQKKLNDTLRCDAFEFPTALSGEQSTSDRLSQFHVSLINSGDRVVDFTSGLGIDAMHFAAEASSVTAIELDSAVANALVTNSTAMGLANLTVINADCTLWIKNSNSKFDVAFIDPARRGCVGERVFALHQCVPDVTAMLGEISKISSRLIVKMSPMLDISQVARELPGVSDIYAVGTTDECKELVAVISFQSNATNYRCHAVTLGAGQDVLYSFAPIDEAAAEIEYGMPQNPQYLYEPYPSTMKAGPFKLLSRQFGLSALHPNTHLYVSDRYIDGFPGVIMAVDDVLPFSSSAIKQLKKRKLLASVTVRNFDITAADLRARIKSRESSSVRLFGLAVSGVSPSRQLFLTHVINQ